MKNPKLQFKSQKLLITTLPTTSIHAFWQLSMELDLFFTIITSNLTYNHKIRNKTKFNLFAVLLFEKLSKRIRSNSTNLARTKLETSLIQITSTFIVDKVTFLQHGVSNTLEFVTPSY